jgi:hypothetical protein
MFEDVDRQRKYDGRILFGRDGVERLKVAQLQEHNKSLIVSLFVKDNSRYILEEHQGTRR